MTLLSIYFSHNENKYITLPINTVPVDSDFFLFVAGIYTGIGRGGGKYDVHHFTGITFFCFKQFRFLCSM